MVTLFSALSGRSPSGPELHRVEKKHEYTIENRWEAVYDKNDLLAAMAYDGDGNRIFHGYGYGNE